MRGRVSGISLQGLLERRDCFVEMSLPCAEDAQAVVRVRGIVESKQPLEAYLRFVRHPQRHQAKSQDLVTPRLIWRDRQSPTHQRDRLSRLACLMSDRSKQVQGVGVVRPGLKNRLVKPTCFLQTPRTMVIQSQA